MTDKPVGLVASIRQRLLNVTANTGGEANLIWSRYAIERLLYRLSLAEFSQEFVLKGAALFTVWADAPYRPTLDLDLLAFGEDSEERIADVFCKLCCIEVDVDDGIRFDAGSIRVEAIRENAEYQGRRVRLVAFLGKAKIPVQVDIGFGDVITPAPEIVDFPTLLDLPIPRVRASTRPTVVAEKLHAMIVLGMANSRMKDFFDIHMLAGHFSFNGLELAEAVRATFKRRNTHIPTDAIVFTDEFAYDRMKQTQWNAFIRRIKAKPEMEFPVVLERLRAFLLPVMRFASGGNFVPGYWEIDQEKWM